MTPLEALTEAKNYRLAYTSNGDFYDKEKQDKLFNIIEDALKKYQELLNRHCMLVGRTRRHTKTLIDIISKNYKEIKIINLEDEKKLKALEIIKERYKVQFIKSDIPWKHGIMRIGLNPVYIQTKEEYDLLKEVFKNAR